MRKIALFSRNCHQINHYFDKTIMKKGKIRPFNLAFTRCFLYNIYLFLKGVCKYAKTSAW